MTCVEYRAAVLAGEATAAHEDHAATCPSCRSERNALTTAAALLGDPLLWQEPDTGVEDTVVAAVAGASGATTAPPPVARPRRLILVTAAAAIALVAAGAVFAVAGGPASAGPDWEVDIFAAGAAGGGSVQGWNAAPGTRVALDVPDLPRAPDGFVYELWFSAGDVHISGGTFRGAEDVELWVGVARSDFPRIWVTLEPLDDDPAPSRLTVLDTRR